MNKDMKLKNGDTVYYKLGTIDNIAIHVGTNWCGRTIKNLERNWGCEVTKVERPQTIYENKEILDEQEKEYLGKVIEPFKKRVIRIEKVKTLYDDSEFINIVLYSSISCNKEESIQLPYFKKGTMYKGMKRDKKYTLKELGLD